MKATIENEVDKLNNRIEELERGIRHALNMFDMCPSLIKLLKDLIQKPTREEVLAKLTEEERKALGL